MQFQSRIIKNTILSMFVGSLPDVLFSILAAWYINEGYLWAVVIYFGLQALYFAVWAVRSVFTWAFFLLSGRKKLSTFFCDFLHQNKFPMPGEYEKSPEEYLASVAQNDELGIEAKLKAVHELGSLNMAKSLGQYQYLFRITLAFEDAIEEYRRSLVRSKR